LPDLLALDRQTINSFKYFRGHFGAGLFSLLDHKPPCITLLRDPFEQFVSFMQQSHRVLKKWQDVPRLPHIERAYNVFCGDDYLAQAVFDEEIIPSWFNIQTRYLGCHIDLGPHLGKPSPWVHFETITNQETDYQTIVGNAKRTLDNMAIVGIKERFDDSCRLLCSFLGVPCEDSYPRENLSPDRLHLDASYRSSGMIAPKVVDRILELTRYDYEVYDYGKLLFERQLAALNRDSGNRDAPSKGVFSKIRSLFVRKAGAGRQARRPTKCARATRSFARLR
jgi:hypothetical protein